MILSVGLTCLDMISIVEDYPEEDSDTRCLEHYWQRGGNASNISTVLSTLQAPCGYMGTLAKSRQTSFIEEDFRARGISISTCVYHAGVTTPFATVISNRSNGSRTIIAPPRSLPELTAEEFRERVNLSSGIYKWIHFEGRPCIPNIIEMLSYVDQYNQDVDFTQRITTSVEIEKIRPKIELLLDKADYVFIGKDFAQTHGMESMKDTISHYGDEIREGAILVCPWGDRGAMARTSAGTIHHQEAMQEISVRDSLGAGDTFNAAVILALRRGASIQVALRIGCKIAAMKCTMKGFDGLSNYCSLYDDLEQC